LKGGKPVKLECPEETVVTSSLNKLVLPSCEITFSPPTLRSRSGAEVNIGEETEITAGELTLIYPLEGGMFLELKGRGGFEGGVCGSGCPKIPTLVTVRHVIGEFTAGSITVTISPEGDKKVTAMGGTRLVMPVEAVQG